LTKLVLNKLNKLNKCIVFIGEAVHHGYLSNLSS